MKKVGGEAGLVLFFSQALEALGVRGSEGGSE